MGITATTQLNKVRGVMGIMAHCTLLCTLYSSYILGPTWGWGGGGVGGLSLVEQNQKMQDWILLTVYHNWIKTVRFEDPGGLLVCNNKENPGG